MAVDPAAKAIQYVKYLHKLDTQERLRHARYREQQELYRYARKVVTRGLYKLLRTRRP